MLGSTRHQVLATVSRTWIRVPVHANEPPATLSEMRMDDTHVCANCAVCIGQSARVRTLRKA